MFLPIQKRCIRSNQNLAANNGIHHEQAVAANTNIVSQNDPVTLPKAESGAELAVNVSATADPRILDSEQNEVTNLV